MKYKKSIWKKKKTQKQKGYYHLREQGLINMGGNSGNKVATIGFLPTTNVIRYILIGFQFLF